MSELLKSGAHGDESHILFSLLNLLTSPPSKQGEPLLQEQMTPEQLFLVGQGLDVPQYRPVQDPREWLNRLGQFMENYLPAKL